MVGNVLIMDLLFFMFVHLLNDNGKKLCKICIMIKEGVIIRAESRQCYLLIGTLASDLLVTCNHVGIKTCLILKPAEPYRRWPPTVTEQV